jgi:hypothetical protein
MSQTLQHIATLETLVARRVCTSVIATGADGVAHWVQAADISTSTFPVGEVHHFGDVAIAEREVVLSQFDETTGIILLVMADGSTASVQIVPQDVDTVLL